jgi:hypothetical protein
MVLMMKNIKKTGVAMALLYYWTEYLLDGGVQWLQVNLWTSSIGQCARLRTGALPWPSKRPAF